MHLSVLVSFITDGSVWLMTEGPNFIVINLFPNLVEDIPSSNGTVISLELHQNILYIFFHKFSLVLLKMNKLSVLCLI